jgi:phage baseplate assembly protein gpV
LHITINQAEQRSEPAVVHVDVAAPEVRMEATPVTVNVEPTPVTVINQVPVPEVTVTNEVQTPDVRVDVAAPDVSVAAPTVNVEAPRVTVEAPAGTSTFKVVRDGAGLITGVVES